VVSEDQFAFVFMTVKGEGVLVRGDLALNEPVEIFHVNFAASFLNWVSDRVVVLGAHGGKETGEVVIPNILEFPVSVDVASPAEI
jgi:hypothetical protein